MSQIRSILAPSERPAHSVGPYLLSAAALNWVAFDV